MSLLAKYTTSTLSRLSNVVTWEMHTQRNKAEHVVTGGAQQIGYLIGS